MILFLWPTMTECQVSAYRRIEHNEEKKGSKQTCEDFYVCAACGQAVDMRSLFQVLHHEEECHKPLSEVELVETSPTT